MTTPSLLSRRAVEALQSAIASAVPREIFDRLTALGR